LLIADVVNYVASITNYTYSTEATHAAARSVLEWNCRQWTHQPSPSPASTDREFVTSAKKFANFNEFSEIKKKIVQKFVKCPSGRGLPVE